MDSELPVTLRELLERCTSEERKLLLRALLLEHPVHEYEKEVGASAEMILEAIHRAPELTRRMLRGVIADAAFALRVVPVLSGKGWKNIPLHKNLPYDYRLKDQLGCVTVQVKLQRSEKQKAVVRSGKRYDLGDEVYMVETQRTRTGTKKEGKEAAAIAAQGEEAQAPADLPDVLKQDQLKTRPYRYGEFDILAVCMQPSGEPWEKYMYTLGRWLLVGKKADEMATMQPVSMKPDCWWTDDFQQVVDWLRKDDSGRQMKLVTSLPRQKRALSKTTADTPAKKSRLKGSRPTAP